MRTLVLDASVAVKWAVPSANETLTDTAVRLFQRYRDGEIYFLVPDLFWAELGNVLWSGARRARWTQSDAENAAMDFAARDFTTVSCLSLLPEALKIAFTHDRNIYDCFYVALAVQAKADLITADERLANALAARFPVKWLGAL